MLPRNNSLIVLIGK